MNRTRVALLERLTRLEGRAEALRGELTIFQAVPVVDRVALERRLRSKLADWRGLLTRDLSSGREMLRLLLGPIRFTPVDEERRRGYRFEGTIAHDRMISGLVATPLNVASPAGFVASWMSMEGVTEYLRAA